MSSRSRRSRRSISADESLTGWWASVEVRHASSLRRGVASELHLVGLIMRGTVRERERERRQREGERERGRKEGRKERVVLACSRRSL